jgi:uncharacterized protein (TIGR03435 family)
MTANMAPGGRLNLVNAPVRNLITRAYAVQPFQVIDAPEWVTNDRFDVIAKAEGDATPDQINVMIRSLLADRFKLVARRESRELPVYFLTAARQGGQPGPALKAAAIDCSAAGRGRPGGPAAGASGPVPGPGRGGGCQMMMTPGRMQAAGQPLAAVASLLANQVGRPVLDKTGMGGAFDFTLTWLPEMGRGAPVAPLPPGIELPPIDPDAPSLFTALQEQLGLKLEPGRAPVDVIVIESIQPPVED